MDKYKIDALIALLSDMGAEVRSRREPEPILTGAYVAASGALAWGVAVIFDSVSISFYFHPAIAGALGIIVLGFAVGFKINREYNTYEKARAEQGRIAKRLASELKVGLDYLPTGLSQPQAQSGHLYSIAIIIASGFASAMFCLSIYFTKQ